MKKITAPLTDEIVNDLTAGEEVLLSGVIYTARDQAHKRLCALLKAGRTMPIDLEGQVLYYTGPTPAPPGRVIGSSGPTTSYRMDAYTVPLLKAGLKGMIGKGQRSREVEIALQEYKAVYLAAVGGLGALLSSHITVCTEVAFDDLGPESIKRLLVENFPLFVANDIHGGTMFKHT